MTYQPTILRGMLQKLVLWLERISSLKASIALSIARKFICRHSPYWNKVNVSLFQVSLITSSRDYPVIQVLGGSYLQPRVTATGCALGALIAAYSAVSSPAIAALSAHVHFAIAGQLALPKQQP